MIVIDDEIAPGAPTHASEPSKAQKPKKLVLAVPVAPTSTLQELWKEADEVCLQDQ